jgi:sulfatase modifying factor 1
LTRSSSLACTALGALLLLGQPSLLAAEGAPPARKRQPSGKVAGERARTGGLVVLRSPGPPMIYVRGGTFQMGSSENEVLEAAASCRLELLGHHCSEGTFANELPRHAVTLEPFFLDRTEVTVRDYRRCVELGRCEPLRYAEGARRFDRDDYPVSLVSWAEARAYCRFRGARLPTEAEFERAARGLEGRRFPWGNLFNSRAANHGRLGLDRTDAVDGYAELAPVGSFPAGRTPEGFLDLAGNVSEWVSDHYTVDYNLTRPDPNQPALRVIRGGDYLDAAPWLRGAARDSQYPEARAPFIGFRCARDALGTRSNDGGR